MNTLNRTQEEWRKLGFFYESRDDDKQWYLAGSKKGLSGFIDILVEYANNPQYEEISAHEHYGPYMYLEIMTWDKPGIDGHSIHGKKEDLVRLADLFASKLNETQAGAYFIIDNDFSVDCYYSILVEVKEEDFDPALLDV